jgi:gamma-glutamyltranspeptidase/glutathione hydrolase
VPDGRERAAVPGEPAVGVQAPGDRPGPNPRATRSVVAARNGIVATSQPLASAAGLRALQDGGNAIDAAVTAATVLAVVEPTMNGVGGDLFAIVYDARRGSAIGLNASGRAARAATSEAFRSRGLREVPDRGILSVSVPGVVDGWAELLDRHGTIALDRALEPAIEHAHRGFPVAEVVAHEWATHAGSLVADRAAAATFLPAGRPPAAGEVFRNPALANTLELIAKDGRDAFYRGAIARAIVEDSRRREGLLDEEDLATHRSDPVTPIRTTYRGFDVLELPPNTQGIAALEMLNILEGFDLAALGHNSAACLHLLIEAKRIAYADRDAFVGDAGAVPAGVLDLLLSKDYATVRRREIALARAARSYAPARAAGIGGTPAGPARPAGSDRGDTVYLTAADRFGNVISLIQSIYSGFGAGIVAGDTGILLHNRASLFTLAEGHPNEIGPGKRPFHTLVPAMVLRDGAPWAAFGVMGGDLQAHGHVQVLANLIDFGMNIQEAGEAARFRHSPAGVALESAIPPQTRAGLNRRGHRLVTGVGVFGGFQGILIDRPSGVLKGGSDPRKDGLAIGF